MSDANAADTSEQTPGTPATAELTALLAQECDRMMTLYMQAHDGIQSVFNFYLTFVTAVIGGLVLLIQSDDSAQRDGLLLLLLLFAAITSTVYLSALAGRYAHAGRYAYAVDVLRRQMLSPARALLPSSFVAFLDDHGRVASQRLAWAYWLAPVGTYQMFIALIAGSAFALFTAVVGRLGGAPAGTLIAASMVTLLLTFGLMNAYSRRVIERFSGRINVFMGDDSPAWAARL